MGRLARTLRAARDRVVLRQLLQEDVIDVLHLGAARG